MQRKELFNVSKKKKTNQVLQKISLYFLGNQTRVSAVGSYPVDRSKTPFTKLVTWVEISGSRN